MNNYTIDKIYPLQKGDRFLSIISMLIDTQGGLMSVTYPCLYVICCLITKSTCHCSLLKTTYGRVKVKYDYDVRLDFELNT